MVHPRPDCGSQQGLRPAVGQLSSENQENLFQATILAVDLRHHYLLARSGVCVCIQKAHLFTENLLNEVAQEN